MLLQNHYQNAYVTRDLDRALEVCRTRFGVEDFRQIDATIELKTPAGRGAATLKLALGWAGSLQYELIQPVSGLVDIYREALPEKELLRFHHICMRVHDDWQQWRAELDRRQQPIVLEGGSEGHLQFVYVDARDSLGHFLEYCWMSPQRWTAMGGR